MSNIDSTAIVDSNAEIDTDVTIGPYCVVGPNVKLDKNVKLVSHVTVDGYTTIGKSTVIFPFASIGHIPQDLKYKGEESKLIVGENTTIREYVTMNPGTEGGGMLTSTGSNCLFMASAHIAHDCKIGNGVILANNATLGGHVEVGNHAFIAGLAAVHQFVRIGKHSMVGGMTGVEYDVIPYGTVTGNRAFLSGLNLIGLKRHKFDRDSINGLRQAYRLLFAEEGTLQERIDDVARLFSANKLVIEVIEFMRCNSSRSLCQPRVERAT